MVLKAVTLEVLAIISQDKDIQAGNPAKVADLVDFIVQRVVDHLGLEIALVRRWGEGS